MISGEYLVSHSFDLGNSESLLGALKQAKDNDTSRSRVARVNLGRDAGEKGEATANEGERQLDQEDMDTAL